MKTAFLCIFLILFVLPILSFAEIQNFTTDKIKYFEDQTIFVSGNVDYNENNPFLIVRVLNPSESDFVFLDQIPLQSDGNFKTTIVTGGPKWTIEGPYTILVTYDGYTQEKIIQYSITTQSTDSNKIQEKDSTPTQTQKKSTANMPQKQNLTQETISKNTLENLRERIPGFPSLEKSPNYYFQRYESEKDYQNWFDSQFPGYTIQEVVGYPKTHIPDFPDNSNPPSYYIHRYETESSYQNWFDSQFPEKSIYSVLGFPKKQNIPDWIKINAGWWSTEKISDTDFIQGLQFLIQNKIIQLHDIPQTTISESKIPDWVKNVAGWWSNDSISEDEFIRSLKYLIEQGIVIVN